MPKRFAIFITLASLAVLLSVQAEERIEQDVYWKIRQEATDHSQIMRTLHVLTDVYGPRLTASPNVKAAGEWAADQMTKWGLRNAHQEAWEFAHAGWVNERASAHIVAPVKDVLVLEVLAWTPGTDGPRRAGAVQITLPQRPTQEELGAYFDSIRQSARGKIALIGPPAIVPVTFNTPPLRRDEADLIREFDPNQPQAQPGNAQQQPADRGNQRRVLTSIQADDLLNQFLLDVGSPVRVNDAGRDLGQIRAFANRAYDVAKMPPTVVMRNEDYGRIWRLLDDKFPVELEFDITNRTYPEGHIGYNTIAEIPGTDKADEVVMLGAHLDSWQSATGATDNAIGCAVMMEAARILTALNLKPRRTIRIALWSGEEQGLLGSQSYVRDHFGTFENQKPEFARFGGYFNLDEGTGQARGLQVFGPPATADVLREAIAPFKDLGVVGAISTRSRQRARSDFTSFNGAGLPGIFVEQDPIQYTSTTWHTNLDTYERVIEGDNVKSAIVIASAVYHLAMRDELLPRFSKDQMPQAPPAPRTQGN
jgi:carboxypeptidase Q